MKPRHARRRTGGFTGWDLVVVIVTLGILLFVTLPAVTRDSRKSHRNAPCIANLKQIALAMRMWADDHGDKFPMSFPSTDTNGGTSEYVLSGEVWRHFRILSNEIVSPKVLACFRDERSRVGEWNSFTNNNHLSYFVGVDADETRPHTILSGDRNLMSTAPSTNGVLFLGATDRLEWTAALHNKVGNFAMADGSVQQVTTASLNRQVRAVFSSTTQTVHRLALPE